MYTTNKPSAWFKFRFFLISAFAAISISGTCPALQQSGVPGMSRVEERKNDSSYIRLQHYVDSLFETIAFYDDCIYQKAELTAMFEMLNTKLNSLSDSIRRLNDFKLADICAGLKENKKEEQLKENLWNIFYAVEKCRKEITETRPAIETAENEMKILEDKIIQGQKKYVSGKNTLNTLASSMTSPGKLLVRGARYRFYIALVNEDRIRVHNNPNPNRGQSIREVMDRLGKQKEEVLMITNGGMYTPSYSAQGLLIENARQFSQLDTLKPANNLNFYMQPNGVFYTDSSGFYISTTDEYRASRLNRKTIPLFATQSGPMLITNGIKNNKFKKGSANHYIRSGVGLISNKKIVFIISDDPVNFYDFANVFEEIFGCKNALYLDGAISEMHINEKVSGFKNPKENNGSFGPVISISRKNK